MLATSQRFHNPKLSNFTGSASNAFSTSEEISVIASKRDFNFFQSQISSRLYLVLFVRKT